MRDRKNENDKGEKKMAILTAKCNRPFTVSPEKSKKFLDRKGNRRANQDTVSKITTLIKDKDTSGKS